MRLEELKRIIAEGGEVDLSDFKPLLLEDEEDFLAFLFEVAYEYKYQFYSFQHVLAFHSTDIKEKLKNNLNDIKNKEDIRNLFNHDFYDYKFQWKILDEFLKTIV